MLSVLIWFIEIPLIGIANIFIDIFSGIGSGVGSSASSILGFPGQIFQQTEQAFSGFGVLAPILAALVWGIAFLILIFFIFKAIQLALEETTEDI